MNSIAIVYHSGFGHTEVVANEVAAGALAAGAEVRLYRIAGFDGFEMILADIDRADAVIFGSPTYMGSVSAPFKAFMDASVKVWFAQGWRDKLAAGFTNSGSPSGDKLNVLTTLVIFASQHGMLWVPPAQATAAGDGALTLNRLGSYTGTMTQSDNAPAGETPGADDRATARALGRRVAEATSRWTGTLDRHEQAERAAAGALTGTHHAGSLQL